MAVHTIEPTHEHEWHVAFVEYDEVYPTKELACACGEVSYASA